MNRPYRICSQCIMDTTDPDITFDDRGVCNHCRSYTQLMHSPSYLKRKEKGSLDRLVERIKSDGRGKPYDCIIGVSGGVDSTYVASVTKSLGLNPLAIHLDNGWDSELAVSNIEKTMIRLKIDLYTHVLDWEEFRDLQLSFLKASTPDSEIPSDHAIVATLYAEAARRNIFCILSGTNVATESGGVAAWSQGHADWKYIYSIQRMFGTKKLSTYPHYGPREMFYYYLIKKIQYIPILDYVEYDKKEALRILQEDLCWKNYGGKHYESIYTRFYQGYILPKKFGFDKKRDHLATMIRSGQLTREEALQEMQINDYPPELQQQDREYVIKKLGITEAAFEEIMRMPPRTFWDYPSYKKILYRYKPLISFYHSLKAN